MVIIQAIILGVIQGLTEFIPISSSAHLVIVPWLFGWNDPVIDSLPFDVALHLGTLLAVLVYFADLWVRLIRAGVASIVERSVGNSPDRRLAWLILIGCIPGAIAGILGESKIEEWFHQPDTTLSSTAAIVIAVVAALMGLALFIAERAARHTRALSDLNLLDATIIGFAQALAIIPGVSRSGSTITAGLALGIKRADAARYSFLLSAPIIAGAGLKSLITVMGEIGSGAIPGEDLILFPIGFAAAAISGFFAIRFMLRYLQTNSNDIFVYYRWLFSAIIIIVALMRG